MRTTTIKVIAMLLLCVPPSAMVSANQHGTGPGVGPAVPVRFVVRGRVTLQDDSNSSDKNWTKGTITTIYSGAGTGWYSNGAGMNFVMSAALAPPRNVPSLAIHVTNIINVHGVAPGANGGPAHPFNCHLTIRSAIPLDVEYLRFLDPNGAFSSAQPPVPPTFATSMLSARFHFVTPAGCAPVGTFLTHLNVTPKKTESWIGPSVVDCGPYTPSAPWVCYPRPGEMLHLGGTSTGTGPGSTSGFFSLNIRFLNRNLGTQAGLPRYPPPR